MKKREGKGEGKVREGKGREEHLPAD